MTKLLSYSVLILCASLIIWAIAVLLGLPFVITKNTDIRFWLYVSSPVALFLAIMIFVYAKRI